MHLLEARRAISTVSLLSTALLPHLSYPRLIRLGINGADNLGNHIQR